MFTKYRELGLSLIPIRSDPPEKMKAPVEAEWSKFCERLPTEEECERWDRLYTRYGLACGPASGVLAVDIDSDDVKVLSAVPLSPVRKRGKKGETRFFRFDPEVLSTKVAGCIDILANGRQTLLPPTTHPEGMPYVWLTPDTLEDFPIKDLPLFTVDDLNDLRRTLEPEKWEAGIVDGGVELTGGPWRNDDPRRGCPHGSHDRLKRIVGALIARGASPDEAVRELLRFDEENHLPRGYFSDNTRPDCFADPVSNALFFYASNLRTFNRREVKGGRLPVVPLVSGSEILDVSGVTSAPVQAFKAMSYPEPHGLIKDIYNLIAQFSVADQPGLSMIGAVSVASVLVSNRYKLGDTWPNIYTLGIAPTGAGKSFPINTAMRLLAIDRDTGLFGKEQVLSGQALIKGLESQRERLDVVDECSATFNLILKGGVFQADILGHLLKLYSQSSGLFIGPESKGADPIRVFHPCVSSMMLTNREDFIMSVTRNFISGGLFPRFITFVEWGYGADNPNPHWSHELAEKVFHGIDAITRVPIEMDKVEGKKNLLCPRPYPREAQISPRATELLKQFTTDCRHEMKAESTEETKKHFLTRAGQNAEKLALIHGILSHGMVEERDAHWGIKMIEASLHNAAPLFTQISARTPAEAAVIGVYEVIKRAGFITIGKLYEHTRMLTKMQRNEALDALQIEGKVRLVNASAGRGFEAL